MKDWEEKMAFVLILLLVFIFPEIFHEYLGRKKNTLLKLSLFKKKCLSAHIFKGFCKKGVWLRERHIPPLFFSASSLIRPFSDGY